MNDNELADVLDSYGPGMPLQYEEAQAAAVRLRELSAEVERLRREVVAWKQTALEAEAECDKAEAEVERLRGWNARLIAAIGDPKAAVLQLADFDMVLWEMNVLDVAAEVRAEMEDR